MTCARVYEKLEKNRYFLQKADKYEKITLMFTLRKKLTVIRTLRRESGDIWGWIENNIPWAKTARQVVNTWAQKLGEVWQAWLHYIEKKSESSIDVLHAIDAVQRAMRSNNPRVHWVYELLIATKVLTLNPKELAEKLMVSDGGGWARAITACIEAAEKGRPIQIVQASWGKYNTISLERLKGLVNANPGSYLSKNLIEGFAELWMGGSRELSLSWENWQNIALYLAGNNWKINRSRINGKAREFLGKLYEILRARYANDVENILTPIKKKLWENEAYKNLLIQNNLIDKNGKLSIDLLFQGIQPGQIREIPKLIETKIGRLMSSSRKLLSLGNDILKQNNIDDTSIRGLFRRNIVIKIDGKNTNISNVNISDLSPKQVEQVIPLFAQEIRKFQVLLVSEKNPENQSVLKAHISNLQATLTALTLKYEWYKNAGTASELTVVHRQAEEVLGNAPKNETEEQKARIYASLRESLWSRRSQTVRDAARETGVARSHIEQFEGNISLAEAQRRYNELNSKDETILTPEELAEKRRYLAFIEANITLAKEYHKMETNLGQKEAQAIFTEVNKGISGNAEESYNFQGLTKIATMKSEWVTGDMKNLAWIKPGIENKIQLSRQGDFVSNKKDWEQNLYAAYIQQGMNGYYVILDEHNNPLSTERLSIDQVEWYRDNILTLQWIGVPEMVPYIGFINREIGKRDFYHIDSLDGDFSYEEESRVLQSIAQVILPNETIPKSPNEIIKLLQRKATESGRPTLWEFMKHQMEVLWVIRDDSSFDTQHFANLLQQRKL